MSASKTCSYCGKPLPPDATSCKECGNPVDGGSAPSHPTYSAPQAAAAPGFAVFCCFLTGAMSLGCALVAMTWQQSLGAAACLAVAALSFGIVTWVSFRE